MPTTNILTTLAPTSVTRVEVLEDDWYVTIVDDDEIIVLQESKTIDVDTAVEFKLPLLCVNVAAAPATIIMICFT